MTPRDRLEFWRAYRTLGAPQWSLGVVGKLVRAKHRRYSEHNRKLKLRHGQTAHPGQPGAGGQKRTRRLEGRKSHCTKPVRLTDTR